MPHFLPELTNNRVIVAIQQLKIYEKADPNPFPLEKSQYLGMRLHLGELPHTPYTTLVVILQSHDVICHRKNEPRGRDYRSATIRYGMACIPTDSSLTTLSGGTMMIMVTTPDLRLHSFYLSIWNPS